MCILTREECSILESISRRTRLSLSEEEKEVLCSRITGIMRLFEELDEAITGEVKPLYHVLEVSGKLRDDMTEGFPAEEITGRLKDRLRDGYITAPWKGGYE